MSHPGSSAIPGRSPATFVSSTGMGHPGMDRAMKGTGEADAAKAFRARLATAPRNPAQKVPVPGPHHTSKGLALRMPCARWHGRECTFTGTMPQPGHPVGDASGHGRGRLIYGLGSLAREECRETPSPQHHKPLSRDEENPGPTANHEGPPRFYRLGVNWMADSVRGTAWQRRRRALTNFTTMAQRGDNR
jgi:hypothetical protein